MVIESFIAGAGNLLLAEIPGTTINTAEFLGGAAVIAGGIWLVRKLVGGVLGTK